MSARTPWSPSDDEIDTVARSTDPGELPADRAEQHRTRLLAEVSAIPQYRKRIPNPIIASVGVTLAAAAAITIWMVTRPADPRPDKQHIAELAPSRFEIDSSWPDYVVRLDDGRLSITVMPLATGERFRVKTADAQLEVRGTHFVVGADNGRLTSVVVDEGWVELTRPNELPIELRTGDSWPVVKTADVEATAPTIAPPIEPPTPTAPTIPSNTIPHDPPPTRQPDTRTKTTAKKATTQTSIPTTSSTIEATPTTVISTTKAPAVPPPTPGEADFRAGWAALRAGDATSAVKSFEKACTTADNDAVGEDACFWSGAAAKRAGDNAKTKTALMLFLRKFPSSPRAAEASALIGWALYDAGDLAGAKPYFERASNDKVPKVRESARKGLAAIERKKL